MTWLTPVAHWYSPLESKTRAVLAKRMYRYSPHYCNLQYTSNDDTTLIQSTIISHCLLIDILHFTHWRIACWLCPTLSSCWGNVHWMDLYPRTHILTTQVKRGRSYKGLCNPYPWHLLWSSHWKNQQLWPRSCGGHQHHPAGRQHEEVPKD